MQLTAHNQSTLGTRRLGQTALIRARVALRIAASLLCTLNVLPLHAAIPVIVRPTSPPPQILPRINSFTPLVGAVGTRITITGVNLSSVVSVQIGGVAAPLLAQSATSVVTSVPTGARSAISQ